MERNTLMRAWDRFFGEKNQPDLQRPIRCVKTTEVKELLVLGHAYLEPRDYMRLSAILAELEKLSKADLEKKDKALLRKVQGEAETVGDKQRRYFNAYGGIIPTTYNIAIAKRNSELPFEEAEHAARQEEIKKLALERERISNAWAASAPRVTSFDMETSGYNPF